MWEFPVVVALPSNYWPLRRFRLPQILWGNSNFFLRGNKRDVICRVTNPRRFSQIWEPKRPRW